MPNRRARTSGSSSRASASCTSRARRAFRRPARTLAKASGNGKDKSSAVVVTRGTGTGDCDFSCAATVRSRASSRSDPLPDQLFSKCFLRALDETAVRVKHYFRGRHCMSEAQASLAAAASPATCRLMPTELMPGSPLSHALPAEPGIQSVPS
jgi:hypothetical protein